MERTKKMKKYDAIIIGFGKGGKTLAGFLAGKGQNVALIEKSDKMYGGTCINIGCIPTKKLVDSTKVLKNKGLNGIEEKEKFYEESINNKNTLIGALRGKNYEMLATKENIDIYDGFGSFASKNVVNIASSGNKLSSTKGYLIPVLVSVITANEVTSDPVPLVVGIAINFLTPTWYKVLQK